MHFLTTKTRVDEVLILAVIYRAHFFKFLPISHTYCFASLSLTHTHTYSLSLFITHLSLSFSLSLSLLLHSLVKKKMQLKSPLTNISQISHFLKSIKSALLHYISQGSDQVTFSCSQSYKAVKLACLLHKGKMIDNKMTLLNSKKQKNSLLAKKKSFIGSTTGFVCHLS
jgi:hypothetical protein